MRWDQSFVVGIAEAATGEKGYVALKHFAKQLAIGAVRDVGTEYMPAVYARPLVRLFDREVLACLTFADEADCFRWVFTEPWILDLAGWQETGCDGLALIGMDGDARFFFVPRADEALGVLQESGAAAVIRMHVDHAQLLKWEALWGELCRGETDVEKA
jgi:hypothetical protein